MELNQPARDLYSEAENPSAGWHQLRAYNGPYLTDWALGDRRSATEVFAKLVDYQLAHGRVSVKFLFQPNSTAFWPDPAISAAYPDWLRAIAERTVADSACLRLTGYTSPSGSAEFNDRLSLARAVRIRHDLLANEPRLQGQVTARGVGSQDPIVGTGRDDATDLVDRRVDFDIVPGGRTAAAG